MRTRTLSLLALSVALAAGGCKDKKDKDKKPSEPAAKKPAKPAVKKPAKPAVKKPAAKKPKGPTPKERNKEYFAALKAGRTLSNAKKHADALKKFDEALALVPDDPVVLSEISYSSLKTGDLERAEKAARTSIKGAWRKSIKASSMYNLGRVLEKKKDKDGALKVYLQSYEVRPHPAVAKRISSLGGTVPTLAIQMRPLLAVKTPVAYTDDNPFAKKVAKPETPFEEAYVLQGDNGCDLTVKVAGAYYMLSELSECAGNNRYSRTEIDVKMVKLGAAHALEIRVMEGARDYNRTKTGDQQWTTEEEYTVVYCGAGKSNKPSCTTPIVTKRSTIKEWDGSKPKVSDVRALKLGADKLEVTANGKTKSYPLVFK